MCKISDDINDVVTHNFHGKDVPMARYADLSADKILEKILSDGIVEADEVEALREKLEQDWVVDHSEVELLFRVNHSLGGKAEDCPEWTAFFVDNVSRLLILDLDTPGEIDEAEGDWLAGLLDRYGAANVTEEALLSALQKSATRIAGKVASRFST
jgi:hypothetical protein